MTGLVVLEEGRRQKAEGKSGKAKGRSPQSKIHNLKIRNPQSSRLSFRSCLSSEPRHGEAREEKSPEDWTLSLGDFSAYLRRNDRVSGLGGSPKSEVRRKKWKGKRQKSTIRNQKSEIRNQKSEIRNQKSSRLSF